MFDHANVDGSCLAPSTLEEISKYLKSLEKYLKLYSRALVVVGSTFLKYGIPFIDTAQGL
jgi:hypothetical protein